MITLDQIINSNLEMLKSQEAELLKSLSFVQKAKQLFQSQNGSVSAAPARSRSRKPSSSPAVKKSKPVVAKPAATKIVVAKVTKSTAGAGKDTRLSRIIAVMKQKNAPITSGDLIQTLFKQQKADRNFPHFRQLVYTTLTQAFKRNIIKRKGDKIQLA